MDFGARKIEASDLPKLDSFERSKIESALNGFFDRMQGLLKKELLLHAHFKLHEADGKRKKHSVHLKLSVPGKTVVASESGWDTVSVLQKALKVLERETIESVKRA